MGLIAIGIIGAGIVGERIIKQIQQDDAAQIKAVYDTNTDRLNYIEEQYGIAVTNSLDDLFQTNIDWVYIGTPPNSHAELAERWQEGACTCYVKSHLPTMQRPHKQWRSLRRTIGSTPLCISR